MKNKKIRLDTFYSDINLDKNGTKIAWSLIPTIIVWNTSYFRQNHYGISILFLKKIIGLNIIYYTNK